MRGPFSSLVSAVSALVKSGPGAVYAITLTAGADAATLILDASIDGSGAALWATIKAPINTTISVWFPGGLAYGPGCYATLTGTAPSAAVLYS